MEEEYYRYGDNHMTTVELIGQHLRTHALPWFAQHSRDITTDPLVACGKAAIGQTPLPTLDELKAILRTEASRIGVTKRERQETNILAIHLLAWANQQRLGGSA